MKRIVLILIVTTSLLPVVSFAQYTQPPDPGPYYFVSNGRPGPNQFYWAEVSEYGGINVIENYNLLAAVLGDEAAFTPGASGTVQIGMQLVARQSFDFGGGSVMLQPFAYFQEIGNLRTNIMGLPIGKLLNAFLSDPLGGAQFELTLPFRDPRVALSDRSALLRVGKNGSNTVSTWHIAVDLDVSDHVREGFDVLAPRDGIVEGNSRRGSLCLRHTASNGKEFLTIYQHMVPASKQHLRVGMAVSRGQLLGRVQSMRRVQNMKIWPPPLVKSYTHLHFGVAVRGPSRKVNGVLVPELWYLIDPFGVYDYRRKRFDETKYNYLPEDTLDKEVRGIRHAYVWKTNPPIGSLPRPLIPVRRRGSRR